MTNAEFYNQPKNWKEVYDIYTQCVETSLPEKETKQLIKTFIKNKFNFPDSTLDSLVSSLYDSFSSVGFVVEPQCIITTRDLDNINNYFTALKATPPHDDVDLFTLKKILLSLVFFYRLNFHHSGWIRYEKKNISYLSGISKLPVKQQEKYMNEIHNSFGFSMRVVGSNNPIPCYQFSWSEIPTSSSPDPSPLHVFGPFTPENISLLASQDVLPTSTPPLTSSTLTSTKEDN